MRLHEFLGIVNKKVISVCGCAGKTTTVNHLAEESRRAGRKTCIMTTTHYGMPDNRRAELCRSFEKTKAERIWAEENILVLGRAQAHDGILMPDAQSVEFVHDSAEAIYIEADGSRGMPIKYPLPWEPVILPETDAVLCTVGLTALDRPLEQVCHRFRAACVKMCADRDVPVDERLMAELIHMGYGRFDPIVILNQADNKALKNRGQMILSLLKSKGLREGRVVSLRSFIEGS
ncbi:MAG: putative selenium-dependent hydroxylase accessory protein YqeC [Oscillospiraceae bacterium]|nr:putative selenium-dependent hydroxylase accessory protein YqeC [Oscillospiraceae bacterium]